MGVTADTLDHLFWISSHCSGYSASLLAGDWEITQRACWVFYHIQCNVILMSTKNGHSFKGGFLHLPFKEGSLVIFSLLVSVGKPLLSGKCLSLLPAKWWISTFINRFKCRWSTAHVRSWALLVHHWHHSIHNLQYHRKHIPLKNILLFLTVQCVS